MDLRPLVKASFWFDMTPVAFSPFFERAFFVLFAVMMIGGALLRIMAKNTAREKYSRMTMRRGGTAALILGFVGFIMYFFTFEEVQFFGARFWYAVWGIALVIVIVRLVRFAKKEIPLLRHRDQSRADVNKYLPRRA